MKIVGIVLIALGILALIYRGVTYTEQEKVLDLGPLQATAQRQKTLPIPTWAGVAAIAVGAGLLLLPGSRRR